MFLVFLLSIINIDNSCADTSGRARFGEYNREQALAYSQSAIGRRVENLQFVNTTGEPVALDSFRGKPLIVSFIYTSCYHVCPVITKNLAQAIDVAEEALGQESFSVISIGFDVDNDTPQRLRHFAGQQGVENTNWRFLSANAETIKKAGENFGFIFFPSSKGFDHLAQTTIVDANGMVYRQVYGSTFEPTKIVEPLKELIYGTGNYLPTNLADWINNIRLFCTIYDPSSGRYRFDYSIFLVIITGLVCLIGIALFLFHAWRGNKSSKPAV